MLPLSPIDCYRLWAFANKSHKISQLDPFEFEDRTAGILSQIGFTTFQRRRVHGKSCTMHEQDTIAKKIGSKDFILVECKTGQEFIDKRDVFSLFGKAFDIFNLNRRRLEMRLDGVELRYDFEDVYCIIVSSVPLDKSAFLCSLALGILTVQPHVVLEEYATLPPPLVEYYRLENCGRADIDSRFMQELAEFSAVTRGSREIHRKYS